MINCYHNDLLARNFGIDKSRELIGQKYYWPSLRKDVKSYVRECDVYLTSKIVYHKFYGDLQLLPVPTYYYKDLLMDFFMRLLNSTNQKGDSCNSILVIVDRLMKMVHYKLVKVTINALGLVKVILDVVV